MEIQNIRFVLGLNSLFSALNGAVMILLPDWLSLLLGLSSSTPLYVIGGGLLVFSLYLFHLTQKKDLTRKEVIAIIIQDWAWVVFSILIIGLQAFNLTTVGYWLIAIVAVLVADFAIFQHRYLNQLAPKPN